MLRGRPINQSVSGDPKRRRGACAHTVGALIVLFVQVMECTAAPTRQPHSRYNPYETFAPLVLPLPPNSVRSGSGIPGPGYWQNRADYEIRAVLDPDQKRLAAQEV